MPYSTKPLRLFAQLMSDITVSVWTTIWVFVGLAVYSAISTIADAGRQVESGSKGVADNLASAGHGAQHIPLLGDAVSKPLTAASEAALDIAGAGHDLDTTASWLAVLLAMAVVALPILVAVVPWLFLRLRFFRRKWVVTALAATPAGRTTAGVAGIDEPTAAQTGGDQPGSGRRVAARGSRHHSGAGRPRTAGGRDQRFRAQPLTPPRAIRSARQHHARMGISIVSAPGKRSSKAARASASACARSSADATIALL